MPLKPPRMCPKCRATIPSTAPCPTCSVDYVGSGAKDRNKGYKSIGHARFRRTVLARDPICVLCEQVLATVADHYPLTRRQLVEAGMDPNDATHGRGVCAKCHNSHTARTSPGGWARPGWFG